MSKFTESDQWTSGQQIENFLDDFFSKHGYLIERTTPYEERVLCLGDRHYRFPPKNTHWTIEYKSGIQTFYTGNVFLETISVDSSNKPGWVYTCRANLIFYAAILNNEILVFNPTRLRNQIEDLKTTFKVVKTSKGQNAGYNTHGVIIPLKYVEDNVAGLVIPIKAA